MTRIVLGGIATLLAILTALAAWFLVSEGVGIDRAGVEAPVDEAVEDLLEAEGFLRPAVPEESSGERLATEPVIVEEAAQREEAVSSRLIDGWTLRIVDPSGRVVRGATAWVHQDPSFADHRAFRSADGVDSLMRSKGTRIECQDGELWVPMPMSKSTLVMARHRESWGQRLIKVRTDPGPLELRLGRDVTPSVLAVGPDGRGLAGVGLNLECDGGTLRKGETGRSGTVDFNHVQQTCPDALEGACTGLAVAPSIFTVEDIAMPVPAEAWSGEPMVLQLPALGQVEVFVVDELGEVMEGRGFVTLALVSEGEAESLWELHGPERPALRRRTEAGHVLFEYVEAGAEYTIEVRRTLNQAGTRVHGRISPVHGEVTTVHVQLGEDHPVLRLRVLRPGGTPLVREELSASLNLHSGFLDTWSSVSLRSDAEGYVLVDLPREWSEGMSRRLLLEVDGDEVPASVEIDLSHELPPGLHDLGDVVVSVSPPFAAGRVLDAQGRPVEGARLHVRFQDEEKAYRAANLATLTQADAGGRFEMREWFEGGPFAISASYGGCATRWQPFEPGDIGIELRLPPTGRLSGELLVDSAALRGHLQLRLTPEATTSASGEGRPLTQRSTPAGSSFAFENLVAGTYTLSVLGGSSPYPFVQLEDLVVRAGESCPDPRLRPVDLVGKAHRYSIQITGVPDGDSIEGVIHHSSPGPGGYKASSTLSRAEVLIISGEESIDLRVEVLGHKTVSMRVHPGDVLVELGKRINVTLVLEEGAELPSPPWFVGPLLISKERANSGSTWDAPFFGASRQLEVASPGVGTMEVHWVVIHQLASARGASVFVPERPQVLHVADTDAPQSFQVTLTQADLRRMIEGR